MRGAKAAPAARAKWQTGTVGAICCTEKLGRLCRSLVIQSCCRFPYKHRTKDCHPYHYAAGQPTAEPINVAQLSVQIDARNTRVRHQCNEVLLVTVISDCRG